MAQPELRRRLSMSSDAQWTSKGRTVSSSGYALSSPTASNSNELDDATSQQAAASPGVTTSPGATATRTRQLNASSIFARLGLADASLGSTGLPETRSGSSASSSLNGSRSTVLSSSASIEGLHIANDDTPTVQGGKEASSYMDASNSDNHLGRISPSPTKMTPIEADILLPFADRPAEVKELLQDTERNRGLYELLKETFTVRSANNTSTNLLVVASPPSSPSVSPAHEEPPAGETGTAAAAAALPAKTLNLLRSQEHKRQDSSSTVTPTTPTGGVGDFTSYQSQSKKWDFQDLQTHLHIPRDVLCDQDWIDILKANVYPRSLLLWERLRACLGVDVDDEQGGDRYEPLSSDIEPPSLLSESIAQPGGGGSLGGGLTRSFSSNNSLDLLLSPRAILSRMSSSNSNLNDNPPSSALSSVFSSSLESAASLPSPGGFFPTNLSPFTSPVKQSLPLNIPNAAQASPSRSPNFTLKELESASPSAISRSPVTSTAGITSASMTAARNHRRSSSGGSSFRKAFAMSSIHEDAPLDNFESRDMAPSSSTGVAGGGLKTPENELQAHAQVQAQASVNDTLRNDGKVDLGSLLRLKGYGVGDVPPSPLPPHSQQQGGPLTSSSSIPASSPQIPSGLSSSSYGATNSAAPGHLPPPTPLSPSMSTSYSASSLPGAAAGGSIPRSPSFSSPIASASSALGLKLANPTNFLGSNTASSSNSSAGNSPTKSMNNKYRDSRRDSYDEYLSVFGGSEESRSVSGASVQSRGQGPHMRFSFGSQDAATPALNGPRGGSGFALAGLQSRNGSTSGNNPASARVVAVGDSGSGSGSGKSTPKAR